MMDGFTRYRIHFAGTRDTVDMDMLDETFDQITNQNVNYRFVTFSKGPVSLINLDNVTYFERLPEQP